MGDVAWEAYEAQRRRADSAESMLARAIIAAGGVVRIDGPNLVARYDQLELEREDDPVRDAIILRARVRPDV